MEAWKEREERGNIVFPSFSSFLSKRKEKEFYPIYEYVSEKI
jgi:hypothetical protein